MKFYKEWGNNDNHIIIAYDHYTNGIGIPEYYMVTDENVTKIFILNIFNRNIYRFYGEFTFSTDRYLGNGMISFYRDSILDLNNKKIWKDGILNTKEMTFISGKDFQLFSNDKDVLLIKRDSIKGCNVTVNGGNHIPGYYENWGLDSYFNEFYEVNEITIESNSYLDGNLYIIASGVARNCRIDLRSKEIILECSKEVTININKLINEEL